LPAHLDSDSKGPSNHEFALDHLSAIVGGFHVAFLIGAMLVVAAMAVAFIVLKDPARPRRSERSRRARRRALPRR